MKTTDYQNYLHEIGTVKKHNSKNTVINESSMNMDNRGEL
jgi:hypothetical protein